MFPKNNGDPAGEPHKSSYKYNVGVSRGKRSVYSHSMVAGGLELTS